MTVSPKIAVIGRGMIGASAARHLSAEGHDVTLIGPSEPQDRATHEGVFASHYDEGRITRLMDPHPVWEDLAAKSIQRYGQIEAQSGIAFYDEKGLLIGAPHGSEYLAKLARVRAESQIAAEALSGDALKTAFPYLQFDADMVLYHQSQNAGYISPRRLVAAQTKCASLNGAQVMDAVVEGVSGNTVRLPDQVLQFDKILVACGAFTNALLERPLDLLPFARTVTFLEVEPDEAKRLAAMPSIIWRVADGADPYVLPPIRYPNGRTYLKIGGEPQDRLLETGEAMRTWFQSAGDETLKDYMVERVRALIPDLSYGDVHTESCAVTYTSTRLPLIGQVSDTITVAAGGCGGAAKSCDEIGRIAGLSVLGHSVPRFEVKFKDEARI